MKYAKLQVTVTKYETSMKNHFYATNKLPTSAVFLLKASQYYWSLGGISMLETGESRGIHVITSQTKNKRRPCPFYCVKFSNSPLKQLVLGLIGCH